MAKSRSKEPEPPRVDDDELRQFLALLFADGGMRELRCLDVVRESYPHKVAHTESGYFRPEDVDALATAVAHFRDGSGELPGLSPLSSVAGCYYTLNPVKPAAFGKAPGRMVAAQRGQASTDADIERRTRLLIDVDAPREVPGVPATDTEKAAAFATARAVRAFLAELGWPEPIRIDSGNGAQLVYAIDLPADDGGIVERLLQGLAAQFAEHGGTIDASVHNAARIARLPTTWNRKAFATDERPHRLARVVALPAAEEFTPC